MLQGQWHFGPGLHADLRMKPQSRHLDETNGPDQAGAEGTRDHSPPAAGSP